MPSALLIGVLLQLLLHLAMLMPCMWHRVPAGARILGVVEHSGKPGCFGFSPCIGATLSFLQFAPTVRVVVLGAGSFFFFAVLVCG